MFVCKKKNSNNLLYLHDNNKLIKIDEGQNPDFLPEIHKYEISTHQYPSKIPWIYPVKQESNNVLDFKNTMNNFINFLKTSQQS